MATLPHQRKRAAQAHPETYDVTLRMVLADTDLDPAAIEELAVQMNEAIDIHTGDQVAGVDVSGTYSPPAIEIGMDVVARSMGELHAQLAEVLFVIERECPVTIMVGDTHIERADVENDRELVCA